MNPHTKLQVTCAGCGRQKGEANYWYLVKVDERGYLHVRPFGHKLTRRDQPACGQQCVFKLIERWFTRAQDRVPRDQGAAPGAPPIPTNLGDPKTF